MSTDKNGIEIKKGDTVLVDDPKGHDLWDHSFLGRVDGIKVDGTICVVDGDEDFWDVDGHRTQVQE